MKKAILLMAEGFELTEALATYDVLKRGGVDVSLASISDDLMVTSAQDVVVTVDMLLDEVAEAEADAIILPGGYPGYKNLGENATVGQILKQYDAAGKLICAICGAPSVLQLNGIAPGVRVTGHSCVKDELPSYTYTGTPVERDSRIITAMGAGRSIEFGLAILAALTDDETVAKVKTGMELN